MDSSLIITSHNAHEADSMRAGPSEYSYPAASTPTCHPTIYGNANPLATQSITHVQPRPRFVGWGCQISYTTPTTTPDLPAGNHCVCTNSVG